MRKFLFCVGGSLVADERPFKAFYQTSKRFIFSELNSDLGRIKKIFVYGYKCLYF
jgi:hypothetical protein